MARELIALRRLLYATPEHPAGKPDRRRQVAEKAGLSPDNLYQVAAGVLLKSGRPRQLGRDSLEALNAAFPGWLDDASPPSAFEIRKDSQADWPADTPHLGVAQISILDKRTVAPLLGELQMPIQETKFWARLSDDALAPTMGAETEVLCDQAAQPKPGRFVIVADPAGRLLCRKYVELLPGQWQAEALNPDYKTLDAAAHHLRVVAVVIEARPRLVWRD